MDQLNSDRASDSYPLFVAPYFDLVTGVHYRQCAEQLAERCAGLDIELDLRDRSEEVAAFAADYAARQENDCAKHFVFCRYAPVFIEDMLRQHDRPILYLHCDSEIYRKPPSDAFVDMDIGYSVGASTTGRRHVLANPLYFRPSRTAADFLEIWGSMCRLIDTNRAEHGMLKSTITAFDGHPRVREFPVQISSRSPTEESIILF